MTISRGDEGLPVVDVILFAGANPANIRLDTSFVPFHWGDSGCASLLTGNALDPSYRIPAFKLSAGRIEAVPFSQATDEGAA